MRTFVARGIVLASSLLASGVATAQVPVYGTPSLLPPANTAAAGPVHNGVRKLPRPPSAANTALAQPTSFGRQNDNSESGHNDYPPSVLADSSLLRNTQPPQDSNRPAPSPADGQNSGADNQPNSAASVGSGLPTGDYYSGGYGNEAAGVGCTGAGGSMAPSSGCVTDTVCGTSCGWYAGLGGLIMTRDNENHYLFSFDTANEARQMLDTREAAMNWAGGFETWLGRYFNCGCNAIEVGYWGLFPGQTSAIATAADAVGNLNGIQNWSSLTYNGLTADNNVDDAEAHRLIRDFDYHNLELNILSFSGVSGTATWNTLAGVRYFRSNEYLEFASDPNDRSFTGEVDELYYRINTENNLLGLQVGGNGRYLLTQRLALTTGLKFGVYQNYMTNSSVIGGAAGVATINNGPFNGRAWNVASDKKDIAFLGEFNLGGNYQWNDRWSTYGGYRAVALTGVALPTNQIFSDLRGINDVQTIESNGSLILHGAYAGLTFAF